jgi:hypothetical protein
MNRRTEGAPAPSLRGVTGPSREARIGTARTSDATTASGLIPAPRAAVPSTSLENTMYAMSEQHARAHIQQRHREAAQWRMRQMARAARKARSAARRAESAERRARLAREAAALAARESALAIARLTG